MENRAITLLSAIAILLTMTGCSSMEKRMQQYQAYTDAIKAQNEIQKEAKPIVDMSFVDSGGKPMKLTVNLPVQLQRVEQIKDDEWIAFWGNIAPAAINTGGNLAGNWLNGYYSSKKDKYMWKAIGESIGGGMSIDSGGGDIKLSGAGNNVKMDGKTGGSMSFNGMNFNGAEGESSASYGNQTTAPAVAEEEPLLEEELPEGEGPAGEFVPTEPPAHFDDLPIDIPEVPEEAR